MKEIRIDVVDWWDDNFEDNYFIHFLSKYYKVVRSKDPDYLLCSCFGYEHFKYDCVKIFFTGENITPDFNLYDYALGFDYMDFETRYLRYPLFLISPYNEALKLAEQKHIFGNSQEMLNRGFCSFVVSNGDCVDPIREKFFDEMSKIDFVASGGGFRNNIGKRVENKIDFLRQYKFNIAFENSQGRGYCTEKLIEAFAAQTVPIYWGDLSLLDNNFVNPKSYINISTFSCIQEALGYIQEIDKNNELYLSILQEPAFFQSDIQEYYENKLVSFFKDIFSLNKQIPRSSRIIEYQNQQKKLLISPPPSLCKKILRKFISNEEIKVLRERLF